MTRLADSTQFWIRLSVVGAAMAVLPANPAAAQSVDDMAPLPVPSMTEVEARRCAALIEQFRRAEEAGRVDSSARSLAMRGIALCQHRWFDEGADTLAQAVQQIGEVPAATPRTSAPH
jgi:hypothetical protein